MRAKVTTEFPGRPDAESLPRQILVGEVVTGDLARLAVEQKWAEELAIEDAPKTGAVDIDGMTVDELKSYAKDHNIDLAGASKKDDIKAAIKAA
jgi:hypothetical protein